MDTQITQNPNKKIEASESPAMTLIELTNIINKYVADLDTIREQIKQQRGMFNDAFTNDAEYSKEAEKVKELNRTKNAARQKILKQPAVEAVVLKLKELKDELKSTQEGLSGYLEEYKRVSGTNIIEDKNGEIRQIVPAYRLVKRSKHDL